MKIAECFKESTLHTEIQLPHSFVNDPIKGATQYLHSLLLKNQDDIGVIVAFKDMRVEESVGHVLVDQSSSIFTFHVCVKALVFNPAVNQLLVGIVNAVGAEHIGLLVSGIFNASISITSLPPRKKVVLGSITVGSFVKFRVAKINVGNTMISIEGQINDPSTGLLEEVDPKMFKRLSKNMGTEKTTPKKKHQDEEGEEEKKEKKTPKSSVKSGKSHNKTKDSDDESDESAESQEEEDEFINQLKLLSNGKNKKDQTQSHTKDQQRKEKRKKTDSSSDDDSSDSKPPAKKAKGENGSFVKGKHYQQENSSNSPTSKKDKPKKKK